MQQPSGRPVTTRTVGGHILTALLHGRPVDLARLFEQLQAPLPTEQEWRRLDEVEALVGEKATEAERFDRKRYLREILGASVDVEYADKGAEQKAQEAAWYGHMDTWFHLKAACFTPTFA